MCLSRLGGTSQERAGDVDDQVGTVEGIGVGTDVQFGARCEAIEIDVCHATEANGT